MEILGLSTSPSSGGAYALILSEVEGKRRLPIIIGTFEAQAIALELEHIKPPRPMTHDLMRNILQTFQTYVKYIFINNLREGTFYAEVVFEMDSEDVFQDARPSDAIALAIRFNAPIYVSSEVLGEAGIVAEEGEQEEESEYSEPEPHAEETAGAAGPDEKNRLDVLRKHLDTAIQNEDYERAAKLRDEINKLKG
jgi:bifunctional DNase/RNase